MPPLQITMDAARGKSTFLRWMKMKGGDELTVDWHGLHVDKVTKVE
jgi:hypothetical protein